MWDKNKPVNENPTEEEMKWYCIAHWLDEMYQKFLKSERVNKDIPCNSCANAMFNKCNEVHGNPLVNFLELEEKTDEYVSGGNKTI